MGREVQSHQVGLGKTKVVACIPAYNEEKSIASVVLRVLNYVDHVIVCDDGSSDLTARIAESVGAEVVTHDDNYGKGRSLKTLVNECRKYKPDIIVFLDADGQHDPNAIPKLIEPIESGEADMVVGSRFMEGSKTDAPFYRRIGLEIVEWLNSFRGRESVGTVRDSQSGFRALSSRSFDLISEVESEGFGFETEQLDLAEKQELKVLEVPVEVTYSGLNTSKKNPLSHGVELIGILIRLIVEDRPLLLLGIPGMIFTAIGVGAGIYLIYYFNATRYFSLPLALITMGGTFLGMTFFITGLMLYSISRLKRIIQSNEKPVDN